MAKQHSAEQWEQWISEEQKSALSAPDFCDWVGVSENAFYVWRRKDVPTQIHAERLWNHCCRTRGCIRTRSIAGPSPNAASSNANAAQTMSMMKSSHSDGCNHPAFRDAVSSHI